MSLETKNWLSLPYELLHVLKEQNLKINATGSPAYHNIDWSYRPDFEMHDGKALERLCQQIECERITLRGNSLSDLPAVIAWMDAGAAFMEGRRSFGESFQNLLWDTPARRLSMNAIGFETTSSAVRAAYPAFRSGTELRRVDLRSNNISGLCSTDSAILYHSMLREGGQERVLLQGNPLLK